MKRPDRRVLEVLKRYPETRDNYKLLYVVYLNHCYPHLSLEEAMITWPLQSTIERNCRHIQNTLWMYKPSENTSKRRRHKEEVTREDYSSSKEFYDSVRRWWEKINF